jgi:hypothetical protein
MKLFCPVCDAPLQPEPTASAVLHARCFDCMILLVINIEGIYQSGFVSIKSDEDKEIALISRHFLKK